MRKAQKKQLLDMVATLHEAHVFIKNYLQSGEIPHAYALLSECQQAAAELGTLIEKTEDSECPTVKLLEAYCEYVYHVGSNINQNFSPSQAYRHLNKRLVQVENSIRHDIPMKLEIVFLPYKASMWDSLESIWQAAKEDPDCDAYVIPIPYYDKQPDGSIREWHYEGNLFRANVPVVHYDTYDIETRKPDIIYIHNPYDNINLVTSVTPRYYSSELKKHTEMLVYVPYFVMDESRIRESVEHFALAPGVLHADRVILQSEKVRQIYLTALFHYVESSPSNIRALETKLMSLGSPKYDAVSTQRLNELEIPDEWKKRVGKKKVILYNTHLSLLMPGRYERFLPKLRSVIRLFENRHDVVLLWRPHPLTISTVASMNPDALDEYLQIVNDFRSSGNGIYDDTPNMEPAFAISDAYYGSDSSVVALYKSTGKPVLIHSINVRTENL